MSYDRNIYYYPEAHGLVKVAEHELSEPCYSYDTICVWKNDLGFYLGTDSGCSCPTPFENYNGVSDLTGPLTAEQAVSEAKYIRKNSYYPKYDKAGWKAFKQAIRESR